MKYIIYAFVAFAVPSVCLGETTTVSPSGNCNQIGGEKNSALCNFYYTRPAKPVKQGPSRGSALSQIREFNAFPVYNIDSVEYRNGYSEGSGKYVVVAAIDVTTRFSCQQMMDSKGMPKGKTIEEDINIMSIGFTALQFALRFGHTCASGDRFILFYTDEFQQTENGWILVTQEYIRAERR